MKRILLLMSVLACLITSCSNDDIEVTYTGGLTVNVSTQETFDSFNVTSEIKERFLSKSEGWHVKVYNFIYDETGTLVASDSIHVSTLSQVTFEYDNLTSGSYDILTLEVLVDPDNDYLPNNWVIIGKEDINTIEIIERYSDAYLGDIVGMNSQSMQINDKEDKTVTVAPKGIGALMNLGFYNFGNSPYREISLYTKDAIKGRYLSPYKSGTNKFEYWPYTEERTWYSRGGMTNLGGFSEDFGLYLYLIEDGNINYCYGPAEMDEDGKIENSFYSYPRGGGNLNISDGNPYFGGLIYLGGVFYDDCVSCLYDTYQKFLDWYIENIKNIQTIFLPYLTWGANSTAVDTYMTDHRATLAESGTVADEDMYWSYYENSDGSIGYEYHFNSAKANLNYVFMFFYSMNITQVQNVFSESFEGGDYVSEVGGYLYYSDTTILLVSESEDGSYIQVTFVPNGDMALVRSGDFMNLKQKFDIKRNSK